MKEYIMKLSDALVNEETGEMCLKAEPVKEVIRCKDCAFFNTFFKECNMSMADISPNDFCSKAEPI